MRAAFWLAARSADQAVSGCEVPVALRKEILRWQLVANREVSGPRDVGDLKVSLLLG